MKRLNDIADWLALPARVYLGVVFLMACWFKIILPAEFGAKGATHLFGQKWKDILYITPKPT